MKGGVMKEQQTFVLWHRSFSESMPRGTTTSNLDELNELLKQGWYVHNSCPMSNGSNMGLCAFVLEKDQ